MRGWMPAVRFDWVVGAMMTTAACRVLLTTNTNTIHAAAVRRDDWSRTGGAFVPHPAGGVVYGGLLPGNRGLAEGFWLLDVLGLLE